MKALTILLGLLATFSLHSQQRMVSYDSLHNRTGNVELSNIKTMSAEYNAETTEIIIFTDYVEEGKTYTSYLVEGITTTESFKIYHLKDKNVMFEVVIGDSYFILQYDDHYDVFPQNE